MRQLLRILAMVAMTGLALCKHAQAVDVLTSRNDLARTGVNSQERLLKPANVNARSFGKLWTLYADGQVVAQPLYVSGLQVDTSGNPNTPLMKGKFNAVLVATLHNTVYLYDADQERPGPQGRNVPLWASWLGQARPGGKDIDMFSTNDPEWGILSTPVIDAAKGVVYVVAWHDDGIGPQGYRYRLHALRMKDGAAALPAVELQAAGMNSQRQKQRLGLALVKGVLYIGFGGDGNRGLLLAHDAATLQQRAVWAVSPNGDNGGLWQAGTAPAADAQGNVYLMTGNGSFDAARSNYGDSFVKLGLDGTQLTVKDYFTPCNQAFLAQGDWDLGSSGPVLIPGTNLVVGSGKWPHVFLLSTANMGRYVAPPANATRECQNPNALQDFGTSETNHHLHGAPVFWAGQNGAQIYLWRENQVLSAYTFANGKIVPTPKQGVDALPEGMPGGMLSLSSSGKTNGILWAVTPLDGDANQYRGARAVVRAIDARDVSRTLWSSEQMSARDRPGLFAKYVPPTIAGGKVFVATYGDAETLRLYRDTRPQQFPARYQVVVYGLLPAAPVVTIDQSGVDVQVLQASTAPLPAINLAACTTSQAGSLDCTDELQRVAEAPPLERLIVPVGYGFNGCQLARVTLSSRTQALASGLAIGFYASDVTAGQFSVDHGTLTPKADWNPAGQGRLKNGEAVTLHQFVGVVNCTLAADTRSQLRFKPYIEFGDTAARKLFRKWDAAVENYLLGGDVNAIDRRAELLQ